jgi:hypothetical protein
MTSDQNRALDLEALKAHHEACAQEISEDMGAFHQEGGGPLPQAMFDKLRMHQLALTLIARAEGRPSPEGGSREVRDWLEKISACEVEVYDEDLRATVVVSMTADECSDLARKALAALSTPSPERAELTADFAKAFPGGAVDNSTFEAIESALDKADAPCQGPDGRWLTLPERIAALAPPKADGEEDVLARAGYARPADITQTLMGPHEWGYHDPVEGGFIEDPAPFAAAELISYLRAERAGGAPAGEVKERTATDYAIEHGGYLARSVTAFLDLIGREEIFDDDAQQHLREEVSDHLQSMRSGVYEFEKRVARAAAALSQPSQVGKEEAQAVEPFLRLAREVINPANGERPWHADSQDWMVVFSFAGQSLTLGDLRRAAALPSPPAPDAEQLGDLGPLVTENWVPTAENIDALPAPLRGYIRLVESNADRERDLALKAEAALSSPPAPAAEPVAISREEIAGIIRDHVSLTCGIHCERMLSSDDERQCEFDAAEAILAKLSSPDVFENAGKANTSGEHVKKLSSPDSSPGEEG